MKGVHKCMKPAIRAAEELGFKTARTRNGHLKFSQPGCAPVFAPTTPGDPRSVQNAVSLIRRSYRGDI